MSYLFVCIILIITDRLEILVESYINTDTNSLRGAGTVNKFGFSVPFSNIVRRAGLMMQARRYKAILEAVESFVRNAMTVQVLDDSDPNYGGFKCPDHLVCEAWAAANTFTTMTVLFFNPNSQFYRSPGLFQRMKLALQFLNRKQNDDGTVNMYFSGEIGKASTVAYMINVLVKAYRLLSREAADGGISHILESFLRKGANALKSKPVFTTTHQWTAASALIDIDKLFIDHSALVKAESYMTSRIDINHDGLYSDRSPVNSMLSNAMLLNIAKKMNRPYLIECVRRNLNFSLYNFYSNGEVATEYSTQLKLESGMPQGYAVWKEMSIIDHNGYYASAGDTTLDVFLRNMKDGYVNYYISDPNSHLRRNKYSKFFVTSSVGELLLAEDEFNNDAVQRLPIPDRYEKSFPNSNIARFRNGKMSATIMGNNKILFALHNGQVVIDGFRITYTYNGHREFLPKKMEIAAKSYILRDWFKPLSESMVENSNSIEQDLTIFTEFTYKGKGFDIDIHTNGQNGIPIQLEFGIRKCGTLIANGREYDLKSTDLVSMEGSEAVIKNGNDSVSIKGGIVQHRIYNPDNNWTANLNSTSLMITPVTPYSGKIQIACS